MLGMRIAAIRRSDVSPVNQPQHTHDRWRSQPVKLLTEWWMHTCEVCGAGYYDHSAEASDAVYAALLAKGREAGGASWLSPR